MAASPGVSGKPAAQQRAGSTRGLAWTINRLSRMGPSEVIYRIGQQLHAALESRGIGTAHTPPPPVGACGRPWLSDIPGSEHFDSERYVRRAETTLAGRFDVFALRQAPLGFPPQWNRDPRTETVAPVSFGKRLNYRDSALVGDIKYLWEPARHLELVRLAQAWHLTGQVRYLSAVKSLLDSWFEQCPYLMGVHWVSSLELAVRLVNWSFTWHLVGGDDSPLFKGASGQAFRQRWLQSVYQHCDFIEGHLSRHSSANNHLMGEFMGLFMGAVTWPLWPRSRRWRQTAKDGLESEALRQVGADGVNREQASWYHHEVTDMLLLCYLVGRANDLAFSEAYLNRLQDMIAFIASLMDVAGNVPMIGDSDDAVMVDLALERDVYRSLLATGAVLFQRPDWYRKAGYFDDKSRWLLGNVAPADGIPAGASTPRRAFEESGYYILGSDFDTASELRIVADAGPLGYLSIAAHGHCDALAFTLSLGGREVLIDPGTYAYHTQPVWRDYFRCTSAHNTLRIDGEEQSVPGGNFMWLKHARARCEHVSFDEDRDRFVGSHDGYRRLGDPVVHRRELTLVHGTRSLSVADTIECETSHSVEMFWHLAEHCEATLDGNAVSISTGDSVLTVELPAEQGFVYELVRGDTERPLGWVSRSFDVRQPTTTIRCAGLISGTRCLNTQFTVERGRETL